MRELPSVECKRAPEQSSVVLLAGVAGLVAGAMSMAAGEYVSVSSQSDTEQADLARERRELREQPEFELEELAQIYVARGLEVWARPGSGPAAHGKGCSGRTRAGMSLEYQRSAPRGRSKPPLHLRQRFRSGQRPHSPCRDFTHRIGCCRPSRSVHWFSLRCLGF